MKRILPLVLCALVLCSCAPPKQDVAEVRKVLEAMTEKAEKEMLSGVADTTLANYTEDAVSMPNNGPLLRGKKAIREYYEQMMGSGVKFTAVNFTTTDVNVSGTMAYELGTYTMTMQIPGMGEITDSGKYITVYEQSGDGSWKIKAEAWNTNLEPPMPGTPA